VVEASRTATWRPTGPKTRPFRLGLGGDRSDDPVLARGVVLGDRYRILGLLGEGGMGRVYEAEPLVAGDGGPRVALKILRRERGQSDHLARFRQEAKAASRVGHPSIVQVIELAELPDGTLYMAMERLFGQSFEDWLEAPGRLRDGLAWLAEVGRGLHAAHAAGVMHRDIKPANLFLHVDPRDPGGRVRAKILDFGIAKVVTGDVTHIETQAGTLLGTPYYLAPERALGRSLDARADLYSMGVILYEVLTGLVPFEDESFMGILAQHIRAQPLDPRQAAPDRVLPPGVCLLAMRLLAKDPAQRPADGTAVADELEALLRQEAAAIDAVVTGPRQLAVAGDETVQLQDLALRPTAAPTDASGVRPAASATQALGSGAEGSRAGGAAASHGQTTQRAGSRARPQWGAEVSGWARSEPAAASIVVARPPASLRWPLWLAGGIGVVALGGAASWLVLPRGPGPAAPVQSQAEAEAEPEPVAPPVEGVGTDPPPGRQPPPVADPGTAGRAPASGPGNDTPAAVAGSVPPTPTPSSSDRTAEERTSPTKVKRPRPKPAVPPPPDFKDDD
jgi:serine/threonine protein kinase